jgi:hypothetical protein
MVNPCRVQDIEASPPGVDPRQRINPGLADASPSLTSPGFLSISPKFKQTPTGNVIDPGGRLPRLKRGVKDGGFSTAIRTSHPSTGEKIDAKVQKIDGKVQ